MPQDLEAERSVLAAMMMSPAAVRQVADLLPPRAFARDAHQKAFDALVSLHDDGADRIDMVTLCAELGRRGELDLVGGRAFVASLLEQFTTAANVMAHATVVMRKARLREMIEVTRRIQAECFAGFADTDEILERAESQVLAVAQARTPGGGGDSGLEAQLMTETQLLAADLPPIETVIGDRICARGGITVLGGLPGAGKTFLVHQAARAVATGSKWLEFDCVKGRTAILELEMPATALQERTRPHVNGDGGSIDIDYIAMPRGLGRITEPHTQRALIDLCHNRSLTLLVIDPWNQFHGGDVNRDSDMGPAMDGMRHVTRETGVSILFIHHLNKLQFDKGVDPCTAVILAMKGAGAMCDRSDTILGFAETHGRHRLVLAKVRLATTKPPKFVDLRQTDTGFFERTETPEEMSDETDRKILDWLERLGDQGASYAELERYTGVKRATIQRHLKRLGSNVRAISEGKGGTMRFWLTVGTVATQEEFIS